MKAFKGPKDENFILNHMGELWPLVVYNHFVKKAWAKTHLNMQLHLFLKQSWANCQYSVKTMCYDNWQLNPWCRLIFHERIIPSSCTVRTKRVGCEIFLNMHETFTVTREKSPQKKKKTFPPQWLHFQGLNCDWWKVRKSKQDLFETKRTHTGVGFTNITLYSWLTDFRDTSNPL